MAFNILYDATLIGYVKNTSERRGIFFVQINILKKLLTIPNVNIFLYYDPYLVKDNATFWQSYKTIFSEENNTPILVNENYSILKQEEIHAILNTWLWIPEYLKNLNIKKYMFLYDCMPLMCPTYQYFLTKGDWFRNIIDNINSNDYYFFDSTNTSIDFMKFYPCIQKDQTKIVPLAASNIFEANKNIQLKRSLLHKYNIKTPKYIFALCSLEPRKNILNNIKAFVKFINKNNITDISYVLGGDKWGDFYKTIDKEIENLKDYKKYIITCGYVPDEDLPLLFSNAEWSVYTSLFEGFGLPALEAMQCGCPIISSNTTSLPEVIGKAGILINPYSLEDHVKAYEKFYFDNAYRNEMSKKALERAKNFSWEKTTYEIVKFMKKNYNNKEFAPVEEIHSNLQINTSNNTYTNNNQINYIFNYIFLNFISILKINISTEKRKYTILGFIPLYSYKQIGGRKVWKILGLPIFKIRKINNTNIQKYYIFNCPILKITKDNKGVNHV